MLLESTTGLVILALVLVAGWLLGLASSSGGAKWKERYLAERDAHMANRKIADDKVAVAERRNAELEREHATYRTDADARIAAADRRAVEVDRARPVDTAPASSFSLRPRSTVASPAARPAYPAGERRGWFDWNRGSTVR